MTLAAHRIAGREWLSFLPTRLLDPSEAAREPGRLQEVDGVVMFAHVSGFTAMSEALGRAGGAGTEQLRGIIDELFTSIVAIVRAYGGEIASFAGDGATAVFPRSRADRSAATARRSSCCAFEVQQAVAGLGPRETLAGTFSLSVSVGLASGSLQTTVVGDPVDRLHHVVFGAAVDDCALAGQAAGPGEVVMAGGMLADLRRAEVPVEATPLGGAPALWRVGGSTPFRPRPLTSRAGVVDGMEVVRPYLPMPVFDHLRSERFALVDEHRRVTSLFCRFGDLAHGDASAGRRLQRIATDAHAVITRFGGYLCKLQFGDKGSTMTVLFGAPTGQEDDERRAVACALELGALPSLSGAAIGMHTAVVFCGLVGSWERCEYSVVGDGVNVAARLMQAARPGQVVVSARTQRRAPGPWTWRRLSPLALKGRAGTLALFEPRPRKRTARTEQRTHATLVGRSSELGVLRRRLDALDRGEGGAVHLRGEAGIGKTRLLRAVSQEAAMRGVAVCAGRGEREGAAAPYAAWRPVWRSLLGGRPGSLPGLRRLLEGVSPGFGPRAGMLAPLVGLAGGDDATTAGLPPALRAEALQELAVAVLSRRSASQRLLLLLDDVQWLDPASRELLDRIATAAGPAGFLVLTARRDAGEVRGAESLDVAPLDREAIAQIVRLRHRALPAARRDVTTELMVHIAEKSGGWSIRRRSAMSSPCCACH